jgi:hypothetical protein
MLQITTILLKKCLFELKGFWVIERCKTFLVRRFKRIMLDLMFVFNKKLPFIKGVFVNQACFLYNICHLNLRQNHQF